MDDLFTLHDDAPRAWAHREGFTLAQPGQRDDWPQFLFADGEDAELLAGKEPIKRIPGDRFEDILGGTVGDATDAIEAGGADDILDAVLFAERKHENRRAVLAAIAARSDELQAQEAQQEAAAAIAPEDIMTVE